MALIWLLLCVDGPLALDPERLTGISQLETHGGKVYLFDHHAWSLVRLDTEGGPAARYDRQGQGPGELVRPTRFTVTDEGVYFFSKFMRKLVVLDHDLNVRKELLLPGPAYDMAVSGDQWFFTWHDARTGTMAHGFQPDQTPSVQFGTPLDGADAVGNQIALIGAFGEDLYLVHCFRAVVEVVRRDGTHVRSVPFPPGFGRDLDRIVTQINVADTGDLFLTTSRFSRRDHALLRLRPADGAWSVMTCARPTYVRADGTLYILETREDEVFRLVPGTFQPNP